jgi:hypothetical protein
MPGAGFNTVPSGNVSPGAGYDCDISGSVGWYGTCAGSACPPHAGSVVVVGYGDCAIATPATNISIRRIDIGRIRASQDGWQF